MCPPDLRRANDDEDESSRRRALRALVLVVDRQHDVVGDDHELLVRPRLERRGQVPGDGLGVLGLERI